MCGGGGCLLCPLYPLLNGLKTGLVVIRRTTRRGYAGTTTNLQIVLNTQKICFKSSHPEKILAKVSYPKKSRNRKFLLSPSLWDPEYAPFLPGKAYLKSLYCVGKNTLFNNLFVSILKEVTDAGINIPGYFHSQIKGKHKNVNIPPNIATRANTRGPFLFQCCRVVLNKETNRLELPKGEVVGKTVRSKDEEKEAENENTAVSLVEDKESNLMGKISICFPLNHSGILEANSVPRVMPIFSRIW